MKLEISVSLFCPSTFHILLPIPMPPCCYIWISNAAEEMVSKILKSCFHWLSLRFVTTFLFRSGCTAFNFSKFKFKSNCVVPPKWIVLITREKQSGNCREARLLKCFPPPASFLMFTPLFRLFETVPSNNCTLNMGSLGARHQESDVQETNLPGFTLHGK